MYSEPTTLRSVLNPKYLDFCLSSLYDIGEWKECIFWLRGLNDTYRIKTSNNYYILRIYRQEVEVSEVKYELSLLSQLSYELSSVKTKVAMPIYKIDSSMYTIINAPEGPRIAVLFNYVDGTENVLHDEKSCFIFGQSAAELHLAMDKIVINQPRRNLDTHFLVKQPLLGIVNYLGEKHQTISFLNEFSDALVEQINLISDDLDWGLCHGDMHGNNNAFQVEESFTHYDFEWSALGWRSYDLAQVKYRKRLSNENRTRLWNPLISGYREVRPFSEKDEAAIDLFMIARRLWVMSLDVDFVNDTGVLDYTEDWLEGFIKEFRSYNLVK